MILYKKNKGDFSMTVNADGLSGTILNATHTLISGSTGSGKSTLLETFLYNLSQFNDYNVQFAIIDLKRVSLSRWKRSSKCMAYATTPQDAKKLINDFVYTMELRFEKMEKTDSQKYNGTQLYLIIDEAADLLDTLPQCKKDIVKLMRLGRASNISVIYATQDPSKKTIFAQIQQNCDCLVGLRCRDSIASRQIIGVSGCEKLPRYGKALVYTPQLGEIYKADVILTDDEKINTILNK